jgi:hypothetical protein
MNTAWPCNELRDREISVRVPHRLLVRASISQIEYQTPPEKVLLTRLSVLAFNIVIAVSPVIE